MACFSNRSSIPDRHFPTHQEQPLELRNLSELTRIFLTRLNSKKSRLADKIHRLSNFFIASGGRDRNKTRDFRSQTFVYLV